MNVAIRPKQFLILGLAALAVPVWADPNIKGIPNFHQVNEYVYRGGQPSNAGFQELAKLGVKLVVDLRRPGEHSVEAEEKAVLAAGMRYLNIPMQGIVAPRPEDITKILKLFDAKEPVFVHCKEGKDRTGTVIACYRIAHFNWENEKALAEAKSFGMHWFEPGMKSYIRGYGTADQRIAGDVTRSEAAAR